MLLFKPPPFLFLFATLPLIACQRAAKLPKGCDFTVQIAKMEAKDFQSSAFEKITRNRRIFWPPGKWVTQQEVWFVERKPTFDRQHIKGFLILAPPPEKIPGLEDIGEPPIPALVFLFKPNQIPRLKAVTEKNVGQHFRITLGGRQLAIARLMSPLTEGKLVVNGDWDNLEELQNLLREININPDKVPLVSQI